MFSVHLHAQHQNRLFVEVSADSKVFKVRQEIVFNNQTADTLRDFVLNDWNNAYSGKQTPLAKRFSDEFIRAFHIAKEDDRGHTTIHSITDQNGVSLKWERPANHPDLVDVQIVNPIYPNQKFKFTLVYEVKIPNARFTRFGYDDNTASYNLKDWYLAPARVENNTFVRYSNENLDDIANGISDYEVTLTVPLGAKITSDLYVGNKTSKNATDELYLIGKGLPGFNLVIESKNSFDVYHNNIAEVSCNLKDNRVTDIQKAILIDKITEFAADNLGPYPNGKILVTQADYERSPMYGLNQLPSFLNPYPDAFMFEVRFLKTFTNAYLKNTLKLDPRKDSWLFDAIQMELMMKYIDENHPGRKMMGQLSDISMLQGHHLFDIDFNSQYNYLYLLMARKNLDQPIGDPKSSFIKFNEQIAGKYKAGLALKYLDAYVGDSIVPQSVAEFYKFNLKERQTTRNDFERILKSNTDKDTGWFFTTVIGTRKRIDFKFGPTDAEKGSDSLQVTIKNQTGANVPISLYGFNKGTVVFKQWFTGIETDSIFTIPAKGIDKLALNYNNEIPEYNARNNWKPLHHFFPNKRPIKFTFFQDIEDPRYNQIFYVPSFTFNIYDGFSPGLRFHNKSLLEKPFIFDVEPTYSIKTGELIGSFGLMYNHYIRDERLYNIRYMLGGSSFHYAPDARYTKFTPAVQFRIREDDYRENKKQTIMLRQVIVEREKSAFVATDKQNESYSVFNARYSKYESEITRHYNFYTDVQLSDNFGKLSGEIQYRRLFNDNRRINLRLYAGTFMYRSTKSEFFSFGLDRPSDYMFDYNYYGRSETSGLFSQQFIMAEGGFKSKLDTRYANQWMTTANASFNIWNWVEVYGDAGIFKNHYRDPKFVYDSGIRLNLVPDYFELYFPVYSSNGFEATQASYVEKIRFVVTISPGTLINLFTRKWL
jgi:phenylpyruvate tautomerase PptA (4-oxalocrotonate tautomerase family)